MNFNTAYENIGNRALKSKVAENQNVADDSSNMSWSNFQVEVCIADNNLDRLLVTANLPFYQAPSVLQNTVVRWIKNEL